jgi:hypothetical protein
MRGRFTHSSPRWHEDHTKLVYEVHQTSRTYGGAARPTSPLDTIIRSTSIRSAVFRGFVIMTEEEEKKLARLEQSLVANVDFDDQALHILGFHTGHRHILDEGVLSISFRLERAIRTRRPSTN